MKIEHLAIWVDDLEAMREFYVKYFDLKAGEKYANVNKNFTSYFLTFKNGETRIELMHKSNSGKTSNGELLRGLAHFAIAVGDKNAVNALTERLRKDNYPIVSEPRVTGDGYYESVVTDPEGNKIEITV